MKMIWKYDISAAGHFDIDLPKGAVVRCVAVQFGKPKIWVEFDTKELVNEVRFFELYGTGQTISDVPKKYVGMFQLQAGALVFHLYEVI